MATLKESLKNTMIFSGSSSPVEIDKNESINFVGAYWSWKTDMSPNTISNICCKAKHTGNVLQPNHVCDIEWKNPMITYKSKSYELKLDSEFLLKKYHTKRNDIKDSHYWLEAETEGSIMMVFGYQIQGGSIKCINGSAEKSEGFMPEKPYKNVLSQTVKVNQRNNLRVASFRIIVCLELVCCLPKNDFEPSGMLHACRIYPHQYILANDTFTLSDSKTFIKRNEHASHIHKEVASDNDTMEGDYASCFFTDHNFNPSITTPEKFPSWPAAFQYYGLDLNGEYHVVKSSQTKSVVIKDAVKYKNEISISVTKEPRQGDFDNLHVSRPMQAPLAIRNYFKNDSKWKLPLEKIFMAPVCVHDCLHLHWRWGDVRLLNIFPDYLTGLPKPGKKFNGWGENGPYEVPCGPGVPLNQDVKIKASKGSFSYGVKIASPIKAGDMQFIFHHGMCYGVWIDSRYVISAPKTDVVLPEELKKINSNSWAMFYFNLRYGYGPTDALEFDLKKLISI